MLTRTRLPTSIPAAQADALDLPTFFDAFRAGPAVNIEGASVSGRAIDVEWVRDGLPIIAVPGVHPPGTNTVDVPSGLHALAAHRTVGIELAGKR
jgi:hypothetical protein